MATDIDVGRPVLVLVRHGQSEDNEGDLFSGLRNPALTARGVEEARCSGRTLKALGLRFDCTFTSKLQRAQTTLALILEELGQADLPGCEDAALNERDYGAIAGLNKTQARAQFGTEQVRYWRKSYEGVPPGGESLAMTAARVWPYYEQNIASRLREGNSVLVVAHGNSLRALLVLLEGIAPENIDDVNIGTAEFLTYAMSEDGGTLTRAAMPLPA